jgi:hypothetical protein
MQFPRTEAEVAKLAELVVQGLEQATEDFPAPPVPPADLRVKLDTVHSATVAAVAAESAFREHHAVKDEALEDLADSLKADLKYAEFAVKDRPEKLNQLGWGRRRDGTPLTAPGEVRNIKLVGEGDSWLVLRWQSPEDGGKPAFYKIHRESDGDQWDEIGTSTNTEQLVSNQPRGVSLNFRVTAVNNAGEGPPSATITVVL